MMKSIFAVFIVLFSLLLVANLSCATDDLGGYWKKMMKDQPMPEAIKNLVKDPQASDPFIRDFDIKPNVILYHTHVASSLKQKQQHKSLVNSQSKMSWLEKLSNRV